MKKKSHRMKTKLAVVGSAVKWGSRAAKLARELGREIAARDCVLVTGATTGLTQEAVKGAKERHGFVLGISPAANEQEHVKGYGKPVEGFDIIVFTGVGLIGRNSTIIRTADAVLVVGGQAGTLNEFTTASVEGKVIGVLEGSGQIAELLPKIADVCGTDAGKLIVEKEPAKLVAKVLQKLRACRG